MKKPTRILSLLTFLVLAQGCSGVLTSDQPAKHYYLLQPLDLSSSSTATDDSSSLALQIAAIPGLDTDQILALGTDARLQQYSNARWPDHLPEVLTSTLQRSLESTGHFAFVHAADHTMDGGWLLQLEVREFYGIQGEAGHTSSVRVALAGSISCDGERHALKLRDANPVTEQRLASIVQAHQRGLDGVTRALNEDILRLCGTEPAE